MKKIFHQLILLPTDLKQKFLPEKVLIDKLKSTQLPIQI